jgi:hypothetical protein
MVTELLRHFLLEFTIRTGATDESHGTASPLSFQRSA